MSLNTRPLALFAAAALAFSPALYGAEHPAEHPSASSEKTGSGSEHSEKSGAEHPEKSGAEHPEKSASSTFETSIADVAKAVEKYVEADSKAKGGYFVVYDTVTKGPLALTLKKIHDKRLSSMGGGVYFVCADFEATNGKTYDIDFFMKESKHGLKLTDVVTVHKVDGKARYDWVEKGGKWQRSSK